MVAVPAALECQTPGAAILHTFGNVQLNGNTAPNANALFPDDTVQTDKNSQAKIDVSGSTVTVAGDTLIQFEENEIYLEHGTVQVSTSTQMRVRAGCVISIPVIAGWTQYEVTDVDGKVTVFAHKSDVNLETRKSMREKPEAGRSEKATVREGEQASRPEKCAAAEHLPDYTAGKAAFLNSWEAKTIGVVTVAVIICIAMCYGDDPMSAYKP